MASDVKKVYHDASVYLAVFLEEPGRLEAAQAAILASEQGLTQGHLSGLVMAEVVGAPSLRSPQGPRKPEWEERLAEAVAYFRGSDFLYIEESRRAGLRAMELAVEHGLKGADALHLALAEMAGCDEFYSFDKKHLRVGTLGNLKVMKPYGDPQSEMTL